VTVHH